MASNVRFSTAALNAYLNTLNTTIGSGGKFRIYDGTQPANADTALSGNNVLATLPLSASPFAAAGTHAVTANAITTDTAAALTGTASWGSFLTSANVRVVDCTVGVAADSTDVTLDSKAIQANADVAITSLTLTLNL